MMGVNTQNMQSCLQKCNKLNKSHLVGQLLNSICKVRLASVGLVGSDRSVVQRSDNSENALGFQQRRGDL